MFRFVKPATLLFILCLLAIVPVAAQANKNTLQNALSELSSGNASVYIDLFADPFLFNGGEESPTNTIEIGLGLLTNALPELSLRKLPTRRAANYWN